MGLDPDDVEALGEAARSWRGRVALDFLSRFDTSDLSRNPSSDYTLLDTVISYAIASAPLRGMSASIPRLQRLREKLRPYVEASQQT